MLLSTSDSVSVQWKWNPFVLGSVLPTSTKKRVRVRGGVMGER